MRSSPCTVSNTKTTESSVLSFHQQSGILLALFHGERRGGEDPNGWTYWCGLGLGCWEGKGTQNGHLS